MFEHVKVSPIQSKVGGVFIPVRDIHKAKEWYCKILGIQEKRDVEFGHLFVIPGNGVDIILDEIPMWKENGEEAVAYQTPAFMFQTGDIYAAYEFMKEMGVELVTEVENNQWFVFKDPDGNHLMVC